MMFCEWNGTQTKLYTEHRQLWRTFTTRLPVQCAQVTGEKNDARVAITMTDGHTCVYSGTGQLIRP